MQDRFNVVTGYFSQRKGRAKHFFKECLAKFVSEDEFLSKHVTVDLEFYLGCVLYSQDTSKDIDSFFESAPEDRVKQRKVLRAKIKKVHEVLYKYSHEKMQYFLRVPELASLFTYYCDTAPLSSESDERYDDAISHMKKISQD